MEYVEEVVKKVGSIISVVVGNIAQFFLGPLPRFLLRLGIPYLLLLGLTLLSSLIFDLLGYTVMIPVVSILIAGALIGIMLLVAFIFRKGGHKYDNERPTDNIELTDNGVEQNGATQSGQYPEEYYGEREELSKHQW